MTLKLSFSKRCSTILLILLFASSAYAQSIEGDWFGTASIQGITLRLSLHIQKTNQEITLTWENLDYDQTGTSATSVIFNYPSFSFNFTDANFRFSGEVNPEGTEIQGSLELGKQKFPILFGRKPLEVVPGSIEDLKKKYDKREVYITMRDGIRLFTSIYTPKNNFSKQPVLLNRTPYDIEPYGPEGFSDILQEYSRYAEENYIMVFQDVRGRYMSEGDYEDIRPYIPDKKSMKDTDESTDTWDTVDWIVKNVPNNNGNVGIFGISYPGFYSTMGLIKAHSAVKAVSPQAPVTAWYLGDDIHHNGAFFLLDNFSFYYSFGQPHHSLTRTGYPSFRWPVQDNYEFFMSEGPIKNLAPKYFGDSIKFWNDLFAHPNYDQFWKARDPRQYLKNITPAVMVVGGWFDAEDLYGTLHTYEAIETQNPRTVKNTLVMGPWSHGQWSDGEAKNLGNIYWGQNANKVFIEQEKSFFNYYLKGIGSENIPEAKIFVTGVNEWRNFDSWPPKNITEKYFYLYPDGKISFSAPKFSGSFDEYVSDPMKPVPYTDIIHTERTTEYMTDDQRFASRRPDVMVYQTDVLSQDLTFTGPITADLFVSTTGTDADYIVKLIDVFPPDAEATPDEEVRVPPGGYQMLIRGDVLRGRYRNSFEKPEAFVPGKVTEVRYDLPDIAHTFRKGHKIMIQVQNSWFPLVDRNPQRFVDIYKCSSGDFQKATQRIYHEANYPSHLTVKELR